MERMLCGQTEPMRILKSEKRFLRSLKGSLSPLDFENNEQADIIRDLFVVYIK